MGLVNPTGSSIKSIQRGRSSISADTFQETIAISPVNMGKAIISYGFQSTGTTFSDTLVTVRFDGNASIIAGRQGTQSFVTVEWQVIEYV